MAYPTDHDWEAITDCLTLEEVSTAFSHPKYVTPSFSPLIDPSSPCAFIDNSVPFPICPPELTT